MSDDLTLKMAAERLGVHYMTAYRYVRIGRLRARKVGGEYRIRSIDLDALTSTPSELAPKGESLDLEMGSARYPEMLERRLVDGDEPGAWQLIELAQRSGASPVDVHLDLLIPAMARVGARWEAGSLSVRSEHQATAVATRLLSRLGPQIRRGGSPAGRAVIGCVATDTHALASAFMAEVLRGSGWQVFDLGGDTPADSFAEVIDDKTIDPVDVVAITATNSGNEALVAETIDVVRSSGRVVPILVGGAGIESRASALDLGADGWAADARRGAALFAEVRNDHRRS